MGLKTMDYAYDVFISYRRSRNKSEWLIEHFLPLFEDYLRDEIIAQCKRQAFMRKRPAK